MEILIALQFWLLLHDRYNEKKFLKNSQIPNNQITNNKSTTIWPMINFSWKIWLIVDVIFKITSMTSISLKIVLR